MPTFRERRKLQSPTALRFATTSLRRFSVKISHGFSFAQCRIFFLIAWPTASCNRCSPTLVGSKPATAEGTCPRLRPCPILNKSATPIAGGNSWAEVPAAELNRCEHHRHQFQPRRRQFSLYPRCGQRIGIAKLIRSPGPAAPASWAIPLACNALLVHAVRISSGVADAVEGSRLPRVMIRLSSRSMPIAAAPRQSLDALDAVKCLPAEFLVRRLEEAPVQSLAVAKLRVDRWLIGILKICRGMAVGVPTTPRCETERCHRPGARDTCTHV